MDLRNFGIISCLCLSALILLVSATNEGMETNVVGVGEEEVMPMGTGEVIMKEDAQEIFYNVDFDKYEGIICPLPKAPDNGEIIGEGNEVGSVVYVKCKDGFYLSGPTVMACSPADGALKWDPEVDRKCIKGETYYDETGAVEKRGDEKDEEGHLNGDISPLSPPWVAMRQSRGSSRLGGHPIKDLKSLWSIGEDERDEESQSLLAEQCRLKPEHGPCDSSFLRYYFDQSTMECGQFFYGGCEGNENNFESPVDCMKTCLRKLP